MDIAHAADDTPAARAGLAGFGLESDCVRLDLGTGSRERGQGFEMLADRHERWECAEIGIEAARIEYLRHEADVGQPRLITVAEPAGAGTPQHFL